jgi:hypothetical protein
MKWLLGILIATVVFVVVANVLPPAEQQDRSAVSAPLAATQPEPIQPRVSDEQRARAANAAAQTSAANTDKDFCLVMDRSTSASARALTAMSNAEVERGLCLVSDRLLRAVVARDSFLEALCAAPARRLMAEFKRRFPRRDPGELAGRC